MAFLIRMGQPEMESLWLDLTTRRQQGKLLLREPKNHFDDYVLMFPNSQMLPRLAKWLAGVAQLLPDGAMCRANKWHLTVKSFILSYLSTFISFGSFIAK